MKFCLFYFFKVNIGNFIITFATGSILGSLASWLTSWLTSWLISWLTSGLTFTLCLLGIVDVL